MGFLHFFIPNSGRRRSWRINQDLFHIVLRSGCGDNRDPSVLGNQLEKGSHSLPSHPPMKAGSADVHSQQGRGSDGRAPTHTHTHTHTHLQISTPHCESCNAGDVNTQSTETQSDMHPPALQRAIASIFLVMCAQPGSTHPWVHPPTPTPKPRARAPRGLAPANQLGMKQQISRLQKLQPRAEAEPGQRPAPPTASFLHISPKWCQWHRKPGPQSVVGKSFQSMKGRAA